MDPTTQKSLTQLEYEEAQRIHLPSLIYLLNEEKQPVLPCHIEFGEGGEKLKLFKKTLREKHVVSLFTTPEDLTARIASDLPALADRSGMEVRRGELVKIVEGFARVDWLNDEMFAFFKREIGVLTAKFPSDPILREVFEFLLSGDRQAAAFLVARSTSMDLRGAINVLMEIEKILKGIIERGYGIIAADHREHGNSKEV